MYFRLLKIWAVCEPGKRSPNRNSAKNINIEGKIKIKQKIRTLTDAFSPKFPKGQEADCIKVVIDTLLAFVSIQLGLLTRISSDVVATLHVLVSYPVVFGCMTAS